MKLRLSGLLAAASLMTTTVLADDVPEIVITAKSNQSLIDVLPTAHVITGEEIALSQATDLTELLDSISGLDVRDSGGRGSATDVFVRGTSNTQIIVLIDGVRVGSATLGAAALNNYPIEAIERIEVVKGPMAGIYGADAVGGVIQLFTKKGGEGLGTVRLTAGSDSLFEAGVSFNGKGDNYSFHISADREETDGIDRTSIVTGGNDDIDGYEESAFSLGATWNPTDSTELNLTVLKTDNTSDFDNTFGDDIGNFTDTETLSAALNISTALTDTVQWTTTLGMNEDESSTFSSFPSEFTTERDSVGTELAFSISANTRLTTGVDYYEENIVSSTNYPVDERDNTGVFALLQSDLGKAGLLASVRYDDNSAYGSDTNASVALDYDLGESTKFVVSYGTAFSAPSFNFLYFPFFGNPDLLPEESKSFEVSLRGQSDNVDWRISLYDIEVENLFSFDPATFLAANVGSASLQGLEIDAGVDLGDWRLTGTLDVLDAENEDTGGKLDDRAELNVTLSAARQFEKLGLKFDVHAENNRFDGGGQELPGFVLFDISANYAFNENLKLLANVDNIFDKDYTLNLVGFADRYLTPGRQARVSIQYQF